MTGDHNINTPGNHNRILAKMYFDLVESKNAEGKDKCRKCETLCKDNSGHGNFASHVKHASCWEEELKQHLEVLTRNASGGSMDVFVTISNVVPD